MTKSFWAKRAPEVSKASTWPLAWSILGTPFVRIGVAERWGQLEALAKRRRLTLPTIDAQLAATALHHGLTFVTRNTADIGPTGVPVFDPWSD